jgi:hypothetical protein
VPGTTGVSGSLGVAALATHVSDETGENGIRGLSEFLPWSLQESEMLASPHCRIHSRRATLSRHDS